jgi:hypothetical protein
MPNAKKSSEREQDPAKKSKHKRKKILLKLFGDGACVPDPTNKRTPIDAVVQCRKSRGKGINTPDKAEDGEQDKKKTEMKKSSKSMSSKTTRSDDEA